MANRHEQGLHSYLGVVAFLLGEARVNHKHHSVYSEGGLCDVCRDDTLTSYLPVFVGRRLLKYFLLQDRFVGYSREGWF